MIENIYICICIFAIYLKKKLTSLQISQDGELSAIPICLQTRINSVLTLLAASALSSSSLITSGSTLTTMSISINEIYNSEVIPNL